MCLLKDPTIDYTRDDDERIAFRFILVLMLLFGSVVIRSLVGLAINYFWKSDIWLLILLTTGVSIGKAVGGVLADRYGWLRIAGAALLISGPLVALGINVAWLGITGMLFFNMTTAVTLAAIAGLFPGRPGLAFGVVHGGAYGVYGDKGGFHQSMDHFCGDINIFFYAHWRITSAGNQALRS